MLDEIIVTPAQLGALLRRHVLEVEMRQVGLAQLLGRDRVGGAIAVFVPASHGRKASPRMLNAGLTRGCCHRGALEQGVHLGQQKIGPERFGEDLVCTEMA